MVLHEQGGFGRVERAGLRLSPEEARDYGLIDQVIEHIEQPK